MADELKFGVKKTDWEDLTDSGETSLHTHGDVATHAALDTGVHGAGGDTLATDADITTHAGNADAHHNESHTVASHSDTSATGTELNTLTDGSNADSLHSHESSGLPDVFMLMGA